MTQSIHTEAQIIADFDHHIRQEGSGYRSWYVGITGDVNQRVFRDHQVQREGAWWIWRRAFSSDAARRVESRFLGLGTDGGSGGGDDRCVYVYAYRKTARSNP